MTSLYLMSGAGNLFTVIDNREMKLSSEQLSKLVPEFCKRFKNTESEGLMSLNNDSIVDFNIEFFNPDGSTGMMCGNGGRCAVRFAKFLDVINKTESICFSMAGKYYNAEIIGSDVKLEFDKPISIISDLEIEIDSEILVGDFININSEHFCLHLQEFENRKSLNKFAKAYGSKVRYHSAFTNGSNANFYYIFDNEIHLSTYERGVEKITGACGTGAISTAISAARNGLINFPITIIPPSKQKLIVDIKGPLDNIEKIYLTGNAKLSEIINISIKELYEV